MTTLGAGPAVTIGDQVGGIITDILGSVLRNPGVQVGLRLAAWGMVILWAVTVLWAFRDSLARTRNVLAVLGAVAGIVLATPMAFPLAVIVWRILRPARTVAEAREQQLTIDALLASSAKPTCEGCGSAVNAEWRRCPWCRTWLQAPCPRCERLVELGASVCPWCALDLAPGALVPRVASPAMAPGALVPRVGSPAMAPGPLVPRVGSPALVPVMAISDAMVPVMDPALVEPTQATEPKRATQATPPADLHWQVETPIAPASPPPAAEAAIPPAPPHRRRRSRSGPGAPDLRRQPEEPVRSSTALW